MRGHGLAETGQALFIVEEYFILEQNGSVWNIFVQRSSYSPVRLDMQSG